MIENITPQMPQFWFLLAISTCILLCKATLSYLSFSSHRAAPLKQAGRKVIDLRLGLFLMCASLFMARILWTYLDFYLTQFDTHKIYATGFNALIFKTATVFIGLGFAAFIRAIEKNELNGKLQGIPSIGLILLLFAILVLPLDSLESFSFITTLQLSMNLIGLFIPVVFVLKATQRSSKQNGSKRAYIGGALGVIVYALGANLLNESIMMATRNALGNLALYINYSLLLLCKTIGLTILFVSTLSLDKSKLAQHDMKVAG